MGKIKRIVAFFLALTFLFLISTPIFADGDDNADTGEGGTGGAVKGKGFYRGSEWMYKVSVYVGKISNDWLDEDPNRLGSGIFNHFFEMIGNEPIYVKPKSFSLPSGVIFGKHSKVDYLKGKGLGLDSNPKIVIDNPPPIPITNGGSLSAVKSYFGDTKTLIGLIDAFAEQRGTTREGLVEDIIFYIDGESGKQDPKDILPTKGENGKYTNKVPWLIIYEPVTISYLKDGKTKLAFTATEYALAQKMGLYDFFYSGENAQYIAGMTHANLPNSIVLERDWYEFKAYPPLPAKQKWSNDRIIAGGGWGMRLLRSNRQPKPPIEPPEQNNDKGDYRVDTDVITSFWIHTDGRVTPDNPTTVTFYVGGRMIETMDVVLPDGGSQLVWCKWHTPMEPTTVTVSARISGGGYFEGGDKSTSRTFKIVDLNENIPPDPRAKDPETGKAIRKPAGWTLPTLPKKASNTTANWGVWTAYWEPNWVWHEDWRWIEDDEGEGYWEDYGEWVDEGDWEYEWNSYSASLSAQYEIKPDEKVPTAKQFYNRWEMKSGYGLNIEVDARVSTDAPNSAVATQGNVINYFPEFHYSTYWRLSDRIRNGKFELKENKYSTFNQRVHFTPLWYPDGKYTTYSELIDIWTPAGMLSIGLDDYIEIKGNVWDDWRVVPGRVD